MQKKKKKKIVSARFLFPLSTHKTPVHADGLFGIIVLFVTAVVLCLTELQCIIIVSFCLSTDPKIKNIGYI